MGIRVDAETERRILEMAIPSGSLSHLAPPPASGYLPPPPVGWVAVVVWVPVLPRSEANLGGKRREKIARKSAVKAIVKAALGMAARLDWPAPVRVRLTRCGGKRLDPDNLARSLKAVQDATAEWLGVDDGDRHAVRWQYKQRPGWSAGVEIRIGGE